MATIDKELLSRNVHMAALLESRLSYTGKFKEKSYTFFWFDKPNERPRMYETGFVAWNDLINCIDTPTAINTRISFLKLNTKQDNTVVISAYAPTSKAKPTEKDEIYEQLVEILNKLAKKMNLCCLETWMPKLMMTMTPGQTAIFW